MTHPTPTVARYWVAFDRQLGDQDYAGFSGSQGGHDGSAASAVAQLARELQAAFEGEDAPDGFFEIVGRELVPGFDTPKLAPPSLPFLSEVVEGGTRPEWPMDDDPIGMRIDAAEYRAMVASALIAAGVGVIGWHSGGGIMGLKVSVGPAGYELFSTFEYDGDPSTGGPQWTGFDYTRPDGSLAGIVEIQERPFGGPDPAATPQAMADGVITYLEGYGFKRKEA